jgi:hypothetical protein
MYSVAAWARAGSGTGLPVRSDEFGGIDLRYSAMAARSASVRCDVLLRTTSAMGPSAVVLPGTAPVLR